LWLALYGIGEIMSIKEHALREFKLAGWMDESGAYSDAAQKSICDNILELLDVFAKQGHSGFSADYALTIFNELVNFRTISPLTGEDSEWNEVSEGTLQNNRISSVFKSGDHCYDIDAAVLWEWRRDDDGTPCKSYYTNIHCRGDVVFPYVKPKSPQYIFVPTEEFPNENIY